jgi:thiol:disulfide interchange protein DsbA
MKRSILLCVTVGLVALGASAAAMAAERYQTLDGPKPGDDPDTIEVREFFWYGCPHCDNFRHHIDEWQADVPEGVTFSHVPAIFRPSWEVHARAFYAAKIMGVLDRFHHPMFEAIHDEGRSLDLPEAIGAFVQELGIDGERFVDTMSSFAVNTRIKRAKQLQSAYGIRGTPAVVVDGRYVISAGDAGSFDNMIRIIDERVAAIRGGDD